MDQTSEIHDVETSRIEKNLSVVKQARKQLDNEYQMLANRIALLQQEEMKSWKKIEETRRKAQEIVVLKRKNQERIAMVAKLC